MIAVLNKDTWLRIRVPLQCYLYSRRHRPITSGIILRPPLINEAYSVWRRHVHGSLARDCFCRPISVASRGWVDRFLAWQMDPVAGSVEILMARSSTVESWQSEHTSTRVVHHESGNLPTQQGSIDRQSFQPRRVFKESED